MENRLQPALFVLTGALRGTRRALDGEVVLGTAPEADVRLPPDAAPGVRRRHVEIRRDDDGWHLRAAPGAALFVNGEAVESGRLLPGDVIQVGADGPLLRFRLEPGGGGRYKTLRDALADCVACARFGADSAPARVGLLLQAMPRELFTQTSPLMRRVTLGVVLSALALSAYQAVQSRVLGDRLSETRGRLEAVAASLREERDVVTPAMLDSLRRVVANGAGAAAPDRPDVLATASPSVILVQGAYVFREPGTGRTLRFRGRPDPGGALDPPPRVAPDAEGPPVVRRFTGTAFAVGSGARFVTNRHLVRPWELDPVADSLDASGFLPVFERLRGYLPGRREAVDLEIVAESDSADLALLRATELEDPPPPLPLAGEAPVVGDDVYVLGYPTGIRALLARTDPGLVASLRRDSISWSPRGVLERLAAERAISPLATRGIVGQVTASAVVYDAQTAQGGSGGPVLGSDGRVVAVNRGVMPDFGGSNLGVPVRHVRGLLRRAGSAR